MRAALDHGAILSLQNKPVCLQTPNHMEVKDLQARATPSLAPTKACFAPQAYVNMSLFENFTYAGIDATAEEAWATIQAEPGSAGQSKALSNLWLLIFVASDLGCLKDFFLT